MCVNITKTFLDRPASSEGLSPLRVIDYSRWTFDSAVCQEFFAPVSIKTHDLDSLKKGCQLERHVMRSSCSSYSL